MLAQICFLLQFNCIGVFFFFLSLCFIKCMYIDGFITMKIEI